jgi:hypothetical protein
MIIQRASALFLCGSSLIFLCSCASNVGTRFSMPDVDKLQFGKMQTSDASTLFGKPNSTKINVTPDGNYEFYKYDNAKVGLIYVSERVLLLEFKDGKLNGYYSWSSFNEDKTKLDLKNLGKLRAGLGKLTKDDVLQMVGKPNSKALCPSMIDEFKEKCAKNIEVWGWFMRDRSGFNPAIFNWSALYISFDASGNISSVEAENTNEKPYK